MVDQIGKFSLVDIFVIQFINGSIFSTIRLSPPDDEGPSLAVAVRTDEELGFFAFVMATVASLIIGHVCLYYHHQEPSVKEEHHAVLVTSSFSVTRTSESDAQLRRACSSHSFRDVDAVITGRNRCWVGPLLWVILVVTFIGYAIEAFNVKLLAAGQTINDTPYSMLGFGLTMQTFSLNLHFGTFFSQATFLVFALGTTFLHMAVLLFVWYIKVSPRWWKILNTLAHTLCAWSALEVMVISMVVTLAEMEELMFLFLNGSQMSLLSKILGKSVTDRRAVHLDVDLRFGTYLVGVVAVLYIWVVARLVMWLLGRGVAAHEEQQSITIITSPSAEDSWSELAAVAQN